VTDMPVIPDSEQPQTKAVLPGYENGVTVLQTLLGLLGIPAQVTSESCEDGEILDVISEDPGRLIGRHGNTLNDLQFLVNRILQKRSPDAARVTVDVEGYRKESREKLIAQAQESADLVRRWGAPVELEPMNAYDRRIVHTTLANDPDVQTSSEEVADRDGKKRITVALKPRP